MPFCNSPNGPGKVPGARVCPALTALIAILGLAGHAHAQSELVYSNTNADLNFPPGVNVPIADDIATTAICSCVLDRFTFTVSGDGDGTGAGYNVHYALYDRCPDEGGAAPLPGAEGIVAVPDDGQHMIEIVHEGDPLIIPQALWLELSFDADHGGWLVGQPPELGFSDDFFDYPTIPCEARLAPLFASFAAQVYCSPLEPEVATDPLPLDGEVDIPASPVLTWNNTTTGSTTSSAESETGPFIGPDDFVSGTQHPDAFLQALRDGIAAGEINDPAGEPIPPMPEPQDFGSIAGIGPPSVTPDDLFNYEDTDDIIATGFSDSQLFALMADATNEVHAAYGDSYDFVGFYINFIPEHQIGGAFYLGLQNDVLGIGLGQFNNLPAYGIGGEKLQGWVMMWNQANWSTTPISSTQLVLGQEFEHRFAMYLAPLPGGRPLQGNDGSCGRSAHWNFRVDGQGSGMEIPEWVGESPAQRIGGTLNYNTDIVDSVFSYPDLYLMGYVSGEEMDANASELRYMDENANCTGTYDGPISHWTSLDVRTTNGPRIPDAFLSQKNFSTAWVMIHRPGLPPTSAQKDRVVQMLNHWNETWVRSTLGRGIMTNVLEAPNPCLPSFDVYVGTDNPPTQLACANVAEPRCEPGLLPSETTHYWQVVSQTPGAQAAGPVWAFTTEACAPAIAPENPSPADAETGLPLLVRLEWGAQTTAGGQGVVCETTYDVYFGTENPPTSLLCEDSSSSCDTSVLDPETTYYWRVVAGTPAGEAEGPVWSFSTEACDVPPPLFGAVPGDGSTNQSLSALLTWNNEPTWITFGEVGTGTLVDGMQIADVTFGYEGGFANVDGSNVNTNFLNFPAILADPGVLTLNFQVPVYSMSYGFGIVSDSAGAGESEMILYDGQDNVVGTSTAQTIPLGGEFEEGLNSFASQVPFVRAVITSSNPTLEFLAYDNVIYNPIPPASAVGTGQPLPASSSSPLGTGAATGTEVATAVRDLLRGDRAVAPDPAAVTSEAGGIGCPITYDVYFGTDNPPVDQICEGVSERFCDPGPLQFDETYYWRVNSHTPGQTLVGEVWSFSTPCTYVSSDPPNCFIDPAQPVTLDGSAMRQGVRIFTLQFACDTSSLTQDDIRITVEEGEAPPILFLNSGGNTLTVELLDPIPAGQWTCIELVATGVQSCVASLPGDVNGNGTSEPGDILAVIDALNGVTPLPLASVDVDRSGVAGPADILRVIDLLNGASIFDPWLDVSIADCPSN